MQANTSNLIYRTLMFVAVAACFVGCGGAETKFETMWGQRVDLRGVQSVVALYESSHDGATKRTVEDQMTAKLAQRGIHALPAYSVLENNESADYKTARTALAEKGFDTVLAIRLVSETNEQTIGYYGNTWDGWGYWGWGGPYGYDYYVYDTPIVRVETNLYNLHDDQLVWSATTKTTYADTTKEVVDEVTNAVASKLEGGRSVPTATAKR